MLLVAWRTGVGLVSMRASGETTTILGMPSWWTYAGMLPGIALTALSSPFAAPCGLCGWTAHDESRDRVAVVRGDAVPDGVARCRLRSPCSCPARSATWRCRVKPRCSTTSKARAVRAVFRLRPVGDSAVPADGPVRDAGRPVTIAVRCRRAALIGHFRGGIAMAAVVACAAFGAICGSSVATAATVAQVALPEMRRYSYSGRLATATLAAGGTLGILIPPSVVLVIYAILTEQNIAKLFAARVRPRHHRRMRLPDRDRRVRTAPSFPRTGAAAPQQRRTDRDIPGSVARCGDLRHCVRRHLRRHFHADRGRRGRRGARRSSPASPSASST